MSFFDIYKVGQKLNINYEVPSVDKKLSFVLFPYKASDIINTAMIFVAIAIAGYFVLSPISGLFAAILVFFSVIMAVVLYIYPSHIYYSQRLVEYSEEMIKHIAAYDVQSF